MNTHHIGYAGEPLRFGSLFAGIGGIDLGLERAGMTPAWQVEINPFCREVLAARWPGVPVLEDVREVNFAAVEPVDIIAGGFPCQDVSRAGKRAGLAGARSGLWREMVRAVRLVGPRYVLVENVAALLGRGMGTVLGDLAEGRYDAEWDCLPAGAFGAPGPRDRVFIVAHADGQRQPEPDVPPQPSGPRFYTRTPGADGDGRPTPEPGMVRVGDGLPPGLDGPRIRALGNAVDPRPAEWLGRQILEADRRASA